jgi:hypothetical protein
MVMHIDRGFCIPRSMDGWRRPCFEVEIATEWKGMPDRGRCSDIVRRILNKGSVNKAVHVIEQTTGTTI